MAARFIDSGDVAATLSSDGIVRRRPSIFTAAAAAAVVPCCHGSAMCSLIRFLGNMNCHKLTHAALGMRSETSSSQTSAVYIE